MTDEQDIDEAPELEHLPERMRRFVDAYMGEANGNGTRAARIAGYAGDDNTLAVQASALLRNPKVKRAREARLENDALVAGRMERVRWLTKVMRGEIDAPNLRERLAAQEALSKLAGEQVTKVAQTNAAGEDVQNMSDAQLLVLAGGKRE